MQDQEFMKALSQFEATMFAPSLTGEPRGIMFFDDYTGEHRWIKNKAEAVVANDEGFASRAMCKVYGITFREKFGEELHD
jgi:hypothetical protein